MWPVRRWVALSSCRWLVPAKKEPYSQVLTKKLQVFSLLDPNQRPIRAESETLSSYSYVTLSQFVEDALIMPGDPA
jgi:hypothetical protein